MPSATVRSTIISTAASTAITTPITAPHIYAYRCPIIRTGLIERRIAARIDTEIDADLSRCGGCRSQHKQSDEK